MRRVPARNRGPMMRYEEVALTRDCAVVRIPDGDEATIEAGTPVVITQALGDSFTVQVPTLGGLYRVAGQDADALGKTAPRAVHDAAAKLAREGTPISPALVLDLLREVYDPEIPVNIVDLGLIYDLAVEPYPGGGSRVRVRMTLTAPGCGMGQIIATDVRTRLESVPGVREAEVEVVWEPPWKPERITPSARARLGLD